MNRFMIIAVMVALGATGIRAGERTVTLDEAVAMARARSVDAAVAANELRSAYWEYRTYRANLLPEVTLTATVPSYTRRYSSYQLDDGSYTFLRDNNIMLNGALTVTQRIWATGGTVSVTSSLDLVRRLGEDGSSRYMSVPVAVRLSQPVFGVNDVRWDRRIEPVRYREARAAYISATEQVAMRAVQYYFDLLSARESRSSSAQNVGNAERLYETAKVRRSMGYISENDLMQIEINLLNSRSALTESESRVRACMFALRSFLDMPDDVDIVPVVPDAVDAPDVDYGEALARALDNNAMSMNIRRRQLEADYEVAKARGDLRRINLFVQLGYTGTDRTAGAAYGNLRSNQVVEVGVSLPLLDWGKRRGRVNVARSRRDLVADQLRKEQADFRQDLFVLVERFNNQRGQLALSLRADEIARRRYESSVETFLVGKISALDLNDSQENKDSARAKYLDEMFYYWYYFYQLRSVTLWDFTGTRPVDGDLEPVIRR
ncbi:MAG: TolC family protein [Bacteroidales bacterium]|nr:TolC family protein [Bacteroidales bacterium]